MGSNAVDGVMDGVKVVFLDVDDVLYPPSCGLGSRITENIERYLTARMGVAPADAAAARQRYQRSGTALAGLIAEATTGPGRFDIDEYIDCVYGDIEYPSHIRPNPALRAMLEELGKTRRLWTFSNAHKEHVLDVLKAAGIPATLFEGFIEARGLQFNKMKPDHSAFDAALLACGDCQPRQALLIDDKFDAVESARDYGLQAIHVSNSPDGYCTSQGCNDHQARTASPRNSKLSQSCIQDITQLKQCYPDLFR